MKYCYGSGCKGAAKLRNWTIAACQAIWRHVDMVAHALWAFGVQASVIIWSSIIFVSRPAAHALRTGNRVKQARLQRMRSRRHGTVVCSRHCSLLTGCSWHASSTLHSASVSLHCTLESAQQQCKLGAALRYHSLPAGATFTGQVQSAGTAPLHKRSCSAEGAGTSDAQSW